MTHRTPLAAIVLSLMPLNAWAASPPGSSLARAVPISDGHANMGLGAFAGGSDNGGLMLSLFTAYRYRLVEAGLALDLGANVGAEHSSPGALFGFAYRSANGVRVEMLGEAGIDHYSRVDCGLFCSSGGASANLPWLGARAGLSYWVGSDRYGHFEIGLAATYGTDARHERVTYTNLESGIFGGEVEQTKTMTLGRARASYLLTLGGDFDIWL